MIDPAGYIYWPEGTMYCDKDGGWMAPQKYHLGCWFRVLEDVSRNSYPTPEGTLGLLCSHSTLVLLTWK